MTNFHHRKCRSSVQGAGPEKRWLCSKCRNAALTKDLQELVTNENENEDREIEDTNKGLLQLIKKLKGFVEAEDSSEPEKGDNEQNDPDYILSSVSKESREKVKRKLALGSPTVPKKKAKKQISMPEPSDFSNDSDDNRKKNTSNGTLTNIKFSELYKGSSSYFPGQPFDDVCQNLKGQKKRKWP